jgi:hypothetical protein
VIICLSPFIRRRVTMWAHQMCSGLSGSDESV